ncbi:hypothetical protein M744_00925 [Synechococcus elongatus UTEX 2973]|nr:hypothetical protein M744_00925 [Synechococcus elongatus UTEX 2973]
MLRASISLCHFSVGDNRFKENCLIVFNKRNTVDIVVELDNKNTLMRIFFRIVMLKNIKKLALLNCKDYLLKLHTTFSF